MKRFIVGSVTLILFSSACATPGQKTAEGAAIGTAAGAGIGAIAGGGKGAIIGGLIGAAAGGTVGNRMDAQAQELAKVAETKRTADGILVNLKDDLLFDSGSANVKDGANTQLSQLAGVLSKYPADHIEVAGHTDNTGNASENQSLSVNRANAVKDVLLEHGMQNGQIATEGFGQSKPIASNSTLQGRAKNRRVELFITDTSKQ